MAGPDPTTGFKTSINLLYSIAPEFAEDIRELIRAGGLQALRQRILNELSAEKGGVVDGQAKPVLSAIRTCPAAHRTREEWLNIISATTSSTDAARQTGHDIRTIRKHLDRFDIPDPWKA